MRSSGGPASGISQSSLTGALQGLTTGSSDGSCATPPELTGVLDEFIALGRQTLYPIGSNDSGAAADFKAVNLDPSFTTLTSALSDQQERVAIRISDTETLAGRIDTIDHPDRDALLAGFLLLGCDEEGRAARGRDQKKLARRR